MRVLKMLPKLAWLSYLLKHFSMCRIAVRECISWPHVIQYMDISSSTSVESVAFGSKVHRFARSTNKSSSACRLSSSASVALTTACLLRIMSNCFLLFSSATHLDKFHSWIRCGSTWKIRFVASFIPQVSEQYLDWGRAVILHPGP